MCPANVLQDTLRLLLKVLKSPGCRKTPLLVRTKDDVVLSATNFVSERYANVLLALHYTFTIQCLFLQVMSHLSSVQRVWLQLGSSENVPELAERAHDSRSR